MARDKDWVERRQRAAKCKLHGLHFDPRLTSGCVLCRKEGVTAPPREKPQLVVMLLSLLGIAVVLYRIFGPGDLTAETETAVEEGPAFVVSSSRLDPEDYRSAIEEVERAFFETPASDLGVMGDQIAGALARLVEELNRHPSPKSDEAAAALEDMSRRIIGVPLDLAYLQELRREWERLRRQHFGSELWFVTLSTIDESTDRAALTTYRDVASDLYSLLGEGTARAVDASTPLAPNTVDPDYQARKLEEWRLFQSGWRQEIDSLKDRLPRRPDTDTDPRILLATQRLEHAFSQASSLASLEGMPAPRRVEDAVETVRRALQSFEDLLER